MALTKEKVLVSVKIGVESSTISVKWVNRIIEDGSVLSEIPHRCCYSIERKEQFLTEVEGAEQYIIAAGWA